MFSYLNHCKEHLTYENFINSLEFKEGYCKFNLTKSYIGSGYIIADFELNLIQIKEWYSYLNCFFTLAFFSTFCFLILEYSK